MLDFKIMNQLCIPRVKSTWLCMIYYYLLYIAGFILLVFLKSFASMFINDIGLFLIISSSDLCIKVIATLLN